MFSGALALLRHSVPPAHSPLPGTQLFLPFPRGFPQPPSCIETQGRDPPRSPAPPDPGQRSWPPEGHCFHPSRPCCPSRVPVTAPASSWSPRALLSLCSSPAAPHAPHPPNRGLRNSLLKTQSSLPHTAGGSPRSSEAERCGVSRVVTKSPQTVRDDLRHHDPSQAVRCRLLMPISDTLGQKNQATCPKFQT